MLAAPIIKQIMNSYKNSNHSLSLAGPQRYRSVHNEPVMLRPPVLLLQPAARRVHLLAPLLGPRQNPLPNVPPREIRTRCSISLHGPGYHNQQICDDLPSTSIPQVCISIIITTVTLPLRNT